MGNKVYLNTAEEIVDALQKGEAVYEDYAKGSIKVEYHMYKGVIISDYAEDGNTFINPFSLLVERKRYYVYRKEPIKIEVGKFYKNKEGDKCICVYESTDKKYKNRFLMVIIGALPENNRYCVDEEGKRDYEENPYNIVDYWEDK